MLGLLAAVELDPRRERLVGYLNDDVTQRRLTPWTLRQVCAPEDEHVIAVGPGGGLRRAALLAPPADGPWAAAPVAVAPIVMWWLTGAPARDPDLPAGVEFVDAVATNGAAPRRDQTDPCRVVVASCRDRLRRLQAVQDALDGVACLVVPPPDDPRAWDAIIRQATLEGRGAVLEVESDLSPGGAGPGGRGHASALGDHQRHRPPAGRPPPPAVGRGTGPAAARDSRRSGRRCSARGRSLPTV